MDPSFQLLESKEKDELEDNSLGEARKRNLPLGLGVQSQGAPPNMEESPNLENLVGATNHPQEDEPKPKTIMPMLRSWTLGQFRPRLPSSTWASTHRQIKHQNQHQVSEKGPNLKVLLEIEIQNLY